MTSPILLEVTEILSRTPSVLHGVLHGLPEHLIETNEGDDTFSPRDVLGHLIHGEKTDWVPRIKLILKSGEAEAFEPFDRTGFKKAIQGRSTGSLLAEFDELRKSNLVYLNGLSLTEERLLLRGRHPELGTVTLQQLLVTWAVHDLNHIGQIVRVISRQYTDAVGPWKAYLGILNP